MVICGPILTLLLLPEFFFIFYFPLSMCTFFCFLSALSLSTYSGHSISPETRRLLDFYALPHPPHNYCSHIPSPLPSCNSRPEKSVFSDVGRSHTRAVKLVNLVVCHSAVRYDYYYQRAPTSSPEAQGETIGTGGRWGGRHTNRQCGGNV